MKVELYPFLPSPKECCYIGFRAKMRLKEKSFTVSECTSTSDIQYGIMERTICSL